MCPVMYDNQLQKEVDETNRISLFEKAVGRLVRPRNHSLKATCRRKWGSCAYDYRFSVRPMNGWRSRLHRHRLHVQVMDWHEKTDPDFDYKIVVFRLKDKKLAGKISNLLSDRFGAKKVQIITTHKPLKVD